MTRNIFISVCVLIGFLLSPTRGMAVDYFFKQISIDHGLSHPGVTAILRDTDGTLWVGTKQGLNRVDGNKLKTYFHHEADTTSIAGNLIYNLSEDAEHNLWVVTNGGLSLYDRDNDIFETKSRDHIMAAVNVADGILFGGYAQIVRYDYPTRKIVQLPLINRDPARGDAGKKYLITHFEPVNDSIVLAGTENDGIFTYNLISHEFIPLITGELNLLKALYYDTQKAEIYFSIFQNGLYRYGVDGKPIKHYTTHNSGLSDDIILDIERYADHMWLATDGGGVHIFDTEKEAFSNIHHISGDVNSIPINSITVLYADRKDNLWLGSVRGGVILLKETHIRTYRDVTLGSNKGLSEKAVISLFEDQDRQLWIGTDGGGINRFDPNNETFTHYLNTYGDKISSITGYSDHQLLVSLYGKGLFIFHAKTDRYTPFVIIDEKTNNDECFSGFAPTCHQISPDQVLILAKTAYIFNLLDGRFIKLDFAEEITDTSAFQLVYSDNERSFLTKRNTIYLLENKDRLIKPLWVFDENEDVNSASYEKNKNRLWIATTRGLKFYDINDGKIHHVETRLFDHISYICMDNRGRLWINASNLLFSYRIADDMFMIYDDSDGFLPNNILTLYVRPSKSDFIYMGGSNGLVKIDSGIQHDDDTPVTFDLHDVELDGKVYPGSVLAGSHLLKVPRNYSSLNIHVNPNEKYLFRHTLFRYRIHHRNLNHNSIVESYDNALNLTSLAPGQYDIFVSCIKKNGNWTEETRVFTFEVVQLWYNRIEFILAAMFLILSLSAVAFVLFLKRNKRRLRWRMAMHRQKLNEEKIQFLINVSHELRTPLTLIYAPLKRLLENKAGNVCNPALTDQIENIYHQADHMKGIINWVLDYDRYTTLSDMNVSLTDINELILKIISEFQDEFEEKRIGIRLDQARELDPALMDPAKIRIVISNIVMNALKFSNPDTEITIRTRLIGDRLRVQVEDQGIGLKNIDIDKMFTRFYQGHHDRKGSGIGLSYCKELIDRHGGSIGAFNNDGRGAVVFFELPYKTAPDRVLLKKWADPVSDQCMGTPEDPDEEIDVSSYSVLIADDNTGFREYLGNELKPMFKNVMTAKNGQDALDILTARQADILISDVMMPVMDGYQLCVQVKERIEISHIPVILLTAKGDTQSQKIGYKLGADFYLPKPFDIDLLLCIIHNQLKARETIRQRYRREMIPIPPELSTNSNADEAFMIKLNRLLYDNYGDSDFKVSVIVEHMAMSRASLYKKMKQITGLGLIDYINKYRISYACRLLRETDKSMAEISYETGFTSQRYFSTIFKQSMNQTPSAYRQENRDGFKKSRDHFTDEGQF